MAWWPTSAATTCRSQDGGTDEKGFRLASASQKYRPARPLDGVIVPISVARELLAARDLEGFSALEQRADAVYRALWQIQKQIGMLFPVYVVLTGGEDIPGLSRARRQPARVRCAARCSAGRTPYHLSQVYRTRMGGGSLRRPSPAICGRCRRRPSPKACRRRSPKSCCSCRAPPPSSRSRSAATATASSRPPPITSRCSCAASTSAPRPCPPAHLFLRDLLDRKVFSEFALAKPAPRALLARQRTLRTSQWAAVIFFVILAVGTTRAYLRLSREKGALESFFGESLRNLRDLRRLETSGEQIERQRGPALGGAGARRRRARSTSTVSAPSSSPIPGAASSSRTSTNRSSGFSSQVLFATMKDAYDDRGPPADPRQRWRPDAPIGWSTRVSSTGRSARRCRSKRAASWPSCAPTSASWPRSSATSTSFNDLKLKGNPTDLAKLAEDSTIRWASSWPRCPSRIRC